MAAVTHLLTSPSRASSLTPASDISNIDMDSSLSSSENMHKFSVAKLLNDDNTSLISHKILNSDEDTVLSVGNETPILPDTKPHLSFKNIQNHLNAITQITNNINHHILSPSSNFSSSPPMSECTVEERLSPNSSNRSCTSSPCSPSSYSSYSSNLHHRRMMMNDVQRVEDQNQNLKFSIDNILKADFGRRITEPLNIKKGNRVNKKLTNAVNTLSLNKTSVSFLNERLNPVDLSKSETGAAGLNVDKADKKLGNSSSSSTSAISPASSTATSTSTGSGSSGNGQPMLWPAWVYCTRYSDRPSSGI